MTMIREVELVLNGLSVNHHVSFAITNILIDPSKGPDLYEVRMDIYHAGQVETLDLLMSKAEWLFYSAKAEEDCQTEEEV